jgi:hypothetical protein
MSNFETAQAKLRELYPNGDERERVERFRQRHPEKAREIERMVKVLRPVVAEIVGTVVMAAIKPLVARIRELESNGLKYCGVYQGDQAYLRGSMVTHEGPGWVSRRDTKGERPGDCEAWQLAIKRGRDAR